MDKERANEIERRVIYGNLNYFPDNAIDSASAFQVGRMVGMMQKTLRDELDKEVKGDKE